MLNWNPLKSVRLLKKSLFRPENCCSLMASVSGFDGEPTVMCLKCRITGSSIWCKSNSWVHHRWQSIRGGWFEDSLIRVVLIRLILKPLWMVWNRAEIIIQLTFIILIIIMSHTIFPKFRYTYLFHKYWSSGSILNACCSNRQKKVGAPNPCR